MPRKKHAEWMNPKDALKEFENSNGGRALLKKTIGEYIRDGHVRVQAKIIRKVPGTSSKTAWANSKVVAVSDLIEIPPSKFRSSKRWDNDQSEWRWTNGRFSIAYKLKPRRRTMFIETKLSYSDLKKLLNPRIPKKTGGNQINLTMWQDYMFAAISLSQDGKLSRRHVESQTALKGLIAERMQGDEFSDSHMDAAIRQLWNRFIEPTQIECQLTAAEGQKVP